MKAKVLSPEKPERTARIAPQTAKADDSFEEDWKNGISGDEFLRRVHEHIRKLYASRPKK
ncbi:MAG: hypothetical protein QM642_05950 [Edaphocola sp.]